MLACYKTTRLIFAASIILAFAEVRPARAGFINGGFETGDFTGWSTIGDVSIQTDAFGAGPPQGNYQAFLSNEGAAVSTRQP